MGTPIPQIIKKQTNSSPKDTEIYSFCFFKLGFNPGYYQYITYTSPVLTNKLKFMLSKSVDLSNSHFVQCDFIIMPFW